MISWRRKYARRGDNRSHCDRPRNGRRGRALPLLILGLLASDASAHSGSHAPSRHDLDVHVLADRIEVTARVELPAELLDHDPVLKGTAWLAAGLELHSERDRATWAIEGAPALRTARATLPLPPDAVEVTLADATLLSERTLLRWAVDDVHRPTTIDGLDGVFDGRRRRSLRGQWVEGHPREIVLQIGPAPSTDAGFGPWGLALGLGALGALALIRSGVRRAHRPAPASPPPGLR